ncbi:MAG: ATP-binding protein, partial [Pseudomonadota bacterium]
TLVDEAINTASRVARELRPGILKDFGLAAAIECQAGDFSQRTGIECDTGNINHEVHADDRASLALFRIFQEALTNILKHANASRVAVSLRQDDQGVVLEIEDDGKGIVPDDLAKPKSFGLRGIRERLNALGGTLDIGTSSLGGAYLILRVPHRAGAHEPALPAADRLPE